MIIKIIVGVAGVLFYLMALMVGFLLGKEAERKEADKREINKRNS